ncbi:hypothetical protein [Streptomyces xanthophaeus]|uniref:hypothetical protein n=1 Tax=Streptomyces xanthophaeus TaxID=67385 RepID=UPI002649CB87|nr:hypothetical protein [Streptomyces xanthophaeus]WKD31347.1 hypothetical protein KO717_04845 [Streptomyces xanthophaeus]
MALIDTRLIQTAVIGGRESDQPVILPEQPHNLDEFRRQFGTDRFWCGTLLGGCGQKLMTKRYETKVCHFSHFPGREGSRACDRTATGVDSADHLFIKMHVKEWLADQGHAAQAELRSLGGGPGDAVDFWLRATEQHLRFELRPEDYRSWRRAADSLGAKEGHVEWVFGPDGPITRDMVARQGYALRVRCETVGTDRRVLIGTVADHHLVAWAPLESCRMTKDGMVTPELEALRSAGAVRAGGMRNDPLPGTLPLRGEEIVFAVDSGSGSPAQSSLEVEGRFLVAGFIKPAGSRIIRASVSLPDDVSPPTDQYVYRLSGPARLLITDTGGVDGTHYAVRADALVRLNGLDAERTGLWRPAVSLPEQVSVPAGTRRPEPARPEASTVPDVPGDGLSTVAVQVRQELERVAAQRATTTWHDLARRVGRYLSHLPDPAMRDLLVEVDKPGRPDAPFLCVLVRAPSGRDLPYLGAVLEKLGARAPGSGEGLRGWSGDMRERAYEKYCPRAVPQPSSSYERPAALLAERLRMRLRDAADVTRKLSESPDTDLAVVVQQAESHLEAYKSAGLSTADLRAWLSCGDPIVVDFERLIDRALAASREAANPPAPSGVAAAVGEQEAADAEALAQFQTILDVIRDAQADGNVAAVEAGRRMAGPLYARKLASTDRERYAPFMREMTEWCLSHRP